MILLWYVVVFTSLIVGFGRLGTWVADFEIRYVLRQVRMKRVLQALRFTHQRFRRIKEGNKHQEEGIGVSR